MIEDQDTRILAHLQKDGRATNQQLADEVGMSTSACWRRVRALEDSGVISGYAALVAREQAGFTMSAILHVSLERHDAKFVDEFVSRVSKRREVLECFATTGDADYHLRVVVQDMAAYNRFLAEFMFRIPGIRYVRSNVVLKEIKTGVALPFRFFIGAYCPSRTNLLRKVPTPVMSISTTSPCLMSGEAPSVPIQITSPGHSVKYFVNSTRNGTTPKIMSLVRKRLLSLPLTRTMVSIFARSASVSIHGPIGLKVSAFLERHRLRSAFCQVRSETSLPMV